MDFMATTEMLDRVSMDGGQNSPQKEQKLCSYGQLGPFPSQELLNTALSSDIATWSRCNCSETSELKYEEREQDTDDSGPDFSDYNIEDTGLEYPIHPSHGEDSDYEFDVLSSPLANVLVSGWSEPAFMEDPYLSHACEASTTDPLPSSNSNLKVLHKSHPSVPRCIKKVPSEPSSSSHDRRRRSTKTKLQHLRDRTSRSRSVSHYENAAARAAFLPAVSPLTLGPKRKHCAFVQEQDLKCLFEDRVGTPHLSEVQPGDDLNTQLNVDELSVGGEVAALDVGDAITDIPHEGLRFC
ncbi:hypothetical protein BU23DRAFT_22452 [Bimuria novae-zelandiae CBS 107.79]|uniref:Uncharacterized protein n=1 Tax=Bimuria novae-zelandiae CBS 107.79 TaxID=1447943 RepID=A0A6A5ULM9_9PLEO|nr:hypothetical protein BU23DRAFT_22452 [Bimuria novae-zelandiae CBS 107.79]